MTSVPTIGETFSKLIHHLREAQDAAAMLGHLTRAQGSRKDHALADGWIAVQEMLKRLVYQVTEIAKGKLQ